MRINLSREHLQWFELSCVVKHSGFRLGHAVKVLKALGYKPEGRGFETR
jgi:hypothetical protein